MLKDREGNGTLEADADPDFHVFKTRNMTGFGSRYSFDLWLDLEAYFDVFLNIRFRLAMHLKSRYHADGLKIEDEGASMKSRKLPVRETSMGKP